MENICKTIPKRDYDSTELAKTYDGLITEIKDGKFRLPAFVYSLQLPANENNIILCVDKCKTSNAKIFVELYFSDCKNITLRCVNPHEELGSSCCFCDEDLCASKTGQFKGHERGDYIGPGSPILAVETTEWDAFCANYGCINHTLDDIIDFCKKNNLVQGARPRQHTNEDECRCFISRWTLAAHVVSCTDQSHKLVTVAHPLKRKKPDIRVSFITEIVHHSSYKLVVLGNRSRELYDNEKAVDITIIDLLTDFDFELLKMKVKGNCSKEYFPVHPRFHFGHSSDILGAYVTKCGINTGHTYGQVIAINRLHMVTRNGAGVVDAFGVKSTETNGKAIRGFADSGDSGALTHETMPFPLDPYVYGMVWKKCEGIENEVNRSSTSNTKTVVCVSLSNCLIEYKARFNDIYEFQTHKDIVPMDCQNLS